MLNVNLEPYQALSEVTEQITGLDRVAQTLRTDRDVRLLTHHDTLLGLLSAQYGALYWCLDVALREIEFDQERQ